MAPPGSTVVLCCACRFGVAGGRGQGDMTGVPLPTLQLPALSAGTRSSLQALCTAQHTVPDSALLTSPRTCCPCPCCPRPCPRGGGEGVLQQRQAPTSAEPSIFTKTAHPHPKSQPPHCSWGNGTFFPSLHSHRSSTMGQAALSL